MSARKMDKKYHAVGACIHSLLVRQVGLSTNLTVFFVSVRLPDFVHLRHKATIWRTDMNQSQFHLVFSRPTRACMKACVFSCISRPPVIFQRWPNSYICLFSDHFFIFSHSFFICFSLDCKEGLAKKKFVCLSVGFLVEVKGTSG